MLSRETVTMRLASTLLLLLVPASRAQVLAGNWKAGDIAPPSISAPDNLSTACKATFNQSIPCDPSIWSISQGELWPTATDLGFICLKECPGALQNLAIAQTKACSAASDVLLMDGIAYPANTITQQLLYTYNYTCLQDSSKAYCLPKFDEYNSKPNATSAELCSECNLKELQYQLNSPFGWDDSLAESFSSLRQSCGATGYPITSPTPITLNPSGSGSATATATTTSARPSVTCVSTYTVQAGDDCHSISKSKGVSTFELMYANNLPGYCSDFPKPGAKLCIPHSCQIYTVQANDTCYGIADKFKNAFTVTQLTSWNPNINRACTNLNMIEGYEICVSFPGDAQITAAPTATATATQLPAPTNVAPGTNLKCAKYYTVQDGDTCARVAQINSITTSDFYFLNPEVDSVHCGNLLLGSAYCVQAVGDIEEYPGYFGTLSLNPCLATNRPSSCYTTYPSAPYWEWPTVTIDPTTSTTSTSIVPRPTLVDDLPLAPGSRADCASYTRKSNVTSSKGLNTNTCNFAAYLIDVSVQDFVSWNPSLIYDPSNPTACTLQPGLRYCASSKTKSASSSSSTAASTTKPGTTTTPSTTTTTKTTTTSTGIATPSPIQSGIAANCNKFYYVQDGDGCWAIANAQGISLSDFYAWNPAVGTSCAGLQAKVYVCVGVSMSSSTAPAPSTTSTTKTTTTTTKASTTTTTSVGAGGTPTPVQAGMVSGCNKFYLVKSGDGCWDIANAQGIALASLYSWNPALNGDCSGLWPNYYICVGHP